MDLSSSFKSRGGPRRKRCIVSYATTFGGKYRHTARPATTCRTLLIPRPLHSQGNPLPRRESAPCPQQRTVAPTASRELLTLIPVSLALILRCQGPHPLPADRPPAQTHRGLKYPHALRGLYVRGVERTERSARPHGALILDRAHRRTRACLNDRKVSRGFRVHSPTFH